jgi:hypothetical protein
MARREEWISGKKRNFESSIGDIIYSTVKPIFKNHSKIEADIILNWNKIFDKNMVNKISFKKVVFTDRKANKFILHVNVGNKDWLEISHAAEIIKEQLAIFLGFAGCERVVVAKV